MAPPVLVMLPTNPAPVTDPSATVRPETVRFPPEAILKIRDALLPLIVNDAAPGPFIVRVFAIAISPVVSVIVADGERLNMMVSPELAAATVSLSDPGPLSAVLVTVRTKKALALGVIISALSVTPRTNAITVAHITRRLARDDVFIGFLP